MPSLCRLRPNMQAPDEGPSEVGIPASGIGGRPSTKRLTVGQRNDPRLLRAAAMKYNIDSTKSLVVAYNKTTDKDERAVLLKWLRKYGRRREECLRLESVLEYSELSKIKSRSTHEDDVLEDLFRGLCSRLCQGEFLETYTAIALCRTLTHADPSSYGGTAQLVNVTKKLLGTLSPQPKLTRKNFAQYEATFQALHQAFFLLHMSNRNDIERKEKQDLRRAIAAKESELELSCKYYPLRFHLNTLRQAVERLELRDTPSHITQAMRCVACGLYVLLHVFHCFRNLTRCDIDPAAIADAYGKSQAYFVDMGVSRKAWFDSFRTLMAARLSASKTEMDLEHFGLAYRAAIEEQRTTRDREDSKALRFGIIQELGVLVNKGSPEHVCRDVALKLTELVARQAVDGGWIDDDDVLVALSDVLRDTDAITECNEETKEALRVLYESYRSGASKELTELMKAKDMEGRHRTEISQALQEERDHLCTKIGRDMGYVPPAVMNSNKEDLRRTYMKDDFATVTSLKGQGHVNESLVLEGGFSVRRRIPQTRQRHEAPRRYLRGGCRRAKNQSKRWYGRSCPGSGSERERRPSDREKDQAKEYYEQRTKVTKPIALDDLFKRRSLKPGDPESEVRRVLIYGNPGSGKTCITKVVANKWALREMAREFNAVYVVPVRVLNSDEPKGQQWTSLEEVISRICFSKRKRTSEYEDLALQIEDDLDSPLTLLVVDGLDEANDDAREIVSTIWERSCKVLFLSRPYNMRNIKTRVDVQVECLGFNDEQLRDYIESELAENEATNLIESLQSSTAMWEMAHIPVTAHILCSLSKDHGTATEERRKRASIFQIYKDMANYVWKRFKEKPAARNVKRCDLFDDLERIAFETLRSGLILIQPRLVIDYATSTDAAGIFKESGLLLLVMEGRQYQFPHLTFQEYFAISVRHEATATLDGMDLNTVIPSAINFSSAHGKGLFVIFISTPTTLSTPTEDDIMRSVMLHNVASEDIGTWTKDDVECFFQRLKEEFFDSFPGLRQYFKTKN